MSRPTEPGLYWMWRPGEDEMLVDVPDPAAGEGTMLMVVGPDVPLWLDGDAEGEFCWERSPTRAQWAYRTCELGEIQKLRGMLEQALEPFAGAIDALDIEARVHDRPDAVDDDVVVRWGSTEARIPTDRAIVAARTYRMATGEGKP